MSGRVGRSSRSCARSCRPRMAARPPHRHGRARPACRRPRLVRCRSRREAAPSHGSAASCGRVSFGRRRYRDRQRRRRCRRQTRACRPRRWQKPTTSGSTTSSRSSSPRTKWTRSGGCARETGRSPWSVTESTTLPRSRPPTWDAIGAAGSDAAIEAADVALIADDVTNVAEAVRLGRRAMRISRQNLVFSVLLLAVLIRAPSSTFSR
jgi:hypothetical protein